MKKSCDEPSSGSTDDDFAPPSKKRITNENDTTIEIHESFWLCFDEVAAKNLPTAGTEKSAISNELEFYLKSARLNRTADPYNWWSTNSKQYPKLIYFVKKYLSSPCSSVYSERLFSEAGIVNEEKRNRLLPTNAENLSLLTTICL